MTNNVLCKDVKERKKEKRGDQQKIFWFRPVVFCSPSYVTHICTDYRVSLYRILSPLSLGSHSMFPSCAVLLTILTFRRRNYFFLILAHPVYKM